MDAKGRWDALRGWLEGEGAGWTQWARMGAIYRENADEVLEAFGIGQTEAARARLRREVNAARFDVEAAR